MDTSSANKSSQEKQTKKLTDLLLQQTPQDINEQTFRDRFREDARKNWMANSEQYRNLLTTYVNNIDDNLKSKRCQKKVFLALSVNFIGCDRSYYLHYISNFDISARYYSVITPSSYCFDSLSHSIAGSSKNNCKLSIYHQR